MLIGRNNMEIQVKRKYNYYKEDYDIIPCNEDAKKILRKGRTTIDKQDLNKLKDLGFNVYDCDEEIKKL